jgi:hypothetical protein
MVGENRAADDQGSEVAERGCWQRAVFAWNLA